MRGPDVLVPSDSFQKVCPRLLGNEFYVQPLSPCFPLSFPPFSFPPPPHTILRKTTSNSWFSCLYLDALLYMTSFSIRSFPIFFKTGLGLAKIPKTWLLPWGSYTEERENEITWDIAWKNTGRLEKAEGDLGCLESRVKSISLAENGPWVQAWLEWPTVSSRIA